MKTVTVMYWAVCPKCGGKMLKIHSGLIETICTNTSSKAKWRITVDGDSFKYEHLEEMTAKIQHNL